MNFKLMDYETGEFIRWATISEARASEAAALRDGGAGIIRVSGVRCFVIW